MMVPSSSSSRSSSSSTRNINRRSAAMFIATLLILLSEVNIVHSFYSTSSSLNKWTTTSSCSSNHPTNPSNPSSCSNRRIFDHSYSLPSPASPLPPLRNTENDFSVTGSPASKWYPQEDDPRIPPPLTSLVDVNIDRRAVVYEVTLGRDLGLDIVQGSQGVVVGSVTPGSKAAQLGILPGDTIAATSATAGESLWTHDNAESVKSALATRFVMSPLVKMRLERSLQAIPEEILAVLKVGGGWDGNGWVEEVLRVCWG